MTLVVDFSEFGQSVKRYGLSDECVVYVKPVADSVHLTYVNPQSGIQIVSFYAGTETAAREKLEGLGFRAAKGTWVTEASLEHLARIAGEGTIVAVAYETPDGPGLWLDAWPTPVLDSTALKSLFEEFVAEGHLREDQYEEFLEHAKPVVQILSPEDVQRFIAQKRK